MCAARRLILGTAATCLLGLALALLWGWFVVPLGLPDITWPAGVGLIYVSALLQGMNGSDIEWNEAASEDPSKLDFFTLLSTVTALAAMGMGYIAHSLM